MDFLRCRGLPFFIFVIIFLGIAIRPIESINPVSSAWNERNRTLTSRVTSSSVDANSNARNVASVSTNFLSDLGKSILNNLLWKREQRNITGYDIIIKDPQKYITGEALPAVIVGGIGPLLVILMLITTIVFCSCRYCCNGCGGRNPYKYGYTNAQIWSINILTITTTGLIVFVGAMVIVLSSDLTTAFSSIKTEMNALLTDAAGVFPKLIDGFYQSAETIDTNVGLLGDLIEGYDVANKVNDIFMPTFNNFSSQLTYLSVNLTNARMSCASSDSLIAQISISRASIVTQLGTIRLQIDSLRSVSIQSTVYSINNVPDSNELADARYPSFSIFPNLTQYSARLDDTPNIASILSSAQNTVSNLTNDIPSKFKQQISSVLPQNPGDFLREAAGPIQPSADNIRNQLYNLSNDTDKAIDKYLISGDRIRNDVTKVTYGFIFGGFGLACIGVIAQKRKCMYFLLPIALFFSIIIWIQYFVYYAISLPINEVCYSRDTLLSSQIQIASSIYLQPAYVLRGCANGDTFLNVTINAENQTLSSFTGVDFASTFTNYSQIIETLGLNTNRTSLAGDVSNLIAFPNPSNDLNILSAADLNNVSLPNFNSTSPYDIPKIRADLQSLSDDLSPTYINPDYTSSGMQTNLTNFNNACKLAVPAWADWNDTYIIDNFVKTGYTFSAPANVTNNPSDPNNIAIDAAFNTVFADLTYLHYATLQIASMRASIVTIRSSLLDLSNTQITPLNNNLTYLSANLSNLETSINATLSLIPDVETQLNLTLEGLPLLVRNITDDVLSLVDVTVNATFRNISSTIISATECGTIADDVGNVLTTTCGITLNAINGLWVSFFITGVLLFVGFIISVKGAKRLGMKKKIRPDGNKYIDLEGAKWA